MLDGVTSFFLHQIHVNAFITVKGFGGISIHIMAENWQLLNDMLAFGRFLCVRIKIESC